MYGIKVMSNFVYTRDRKRGQVWVGKTLKTYTIKSKAMLWETEEEAEKELSPPLIEY